MLFASFNVLDTWGMLILAGSALSKKSGQLPQAGAGRNPGKMTHSGESRNDIMGLKSGNEREIGAAGHSGLPA